MDENLRADAFSKRRARALTAGFRSNDSRGPLSGTPPIAGVSLIAGTVDEANGEG